ncbi:MAG: 4-hydroxy-tetrahydrodipicolinate reductase [Pseudomonadota bacterium]
MNVAVAGCLGKVGRSLLLYLMQHPHYHLVAGTVSDESHAKGQDLGIAVDQQAIGIKAQTLSELKSMKTSIDVFIDFSNPVGLRSHAQFCHEHHIPFVTGVSNPTEDDINTLKRYAQDIPVLWATNFSVGIYLMHQCAALIARTLGQSADVGIHELHHKHKKDAPSGTSKGLRQTLLNAGIDSVECVSQRLGEAICSHKIDFILPYEQLSLSHVSQGREVYAEGALKSAEWLIKQNPGFYSFADSVTSAKAVGFNPV